MPVCIGDGQRVHWSPVFDHNPHMAREPFPGCVWIHCYKGKRPYIADRTADRFVYRDDFRVEPGEIYLTERERAAWNDFGGDFVMIEPNVKNLPFSKNKAWGIERWQQVVDALPSIRWVQPKTGKYKLRDVEHVRTFTIREGFALMDRATLFVGTDGALHHAAAALNKRAVVVWGGLASPKNLGYDSHVNLHAGSKPCGSLMPCLHCQMELDKITVDMVVEAVRKEYERAKTNLATDGAGRSPGDGALAEAGFTAPRQQAGAVLAV